MKNLFLLILSTALFACSGDKTIVIDNTERVGELERLAALQDARLKLNEANDRLLEARVTSLESRMDSAESRLDAVEVGLAAFQDQMAIELQLLNDAIDVLRGENEDQDARLDAHAAVLTAHTVAIGVLGAEVVGLKLKDIQLNNKIESLKSRVAALENEMTAARASFPSLGARLDSMQLGINSLNGQVSSLQSDVQTLNTLMALQTIVNGVVQYQIAQLNSKVSSNTADINSLISQVTNLTSVVNGIASTYVTQGDLQEAVDTLQAQIDTVGLVASQAVTQEQLQAAIDAIELLTGPQGPVGPQGPPGSSGTGTSGLVAVKLCAADNAVHPEYGFVVGDSIYAVYYGVVGGTLSAFLAKLNAGTYVTTNDNTPCQFTVSYSNGNSYIDGVQVSPSSSAPPSSGQCSVVNQNSSNNSYLVTTSGTILNSSGLLEVELMGGASITGHNYSGGGSSTSTTGNVWEFSPTSGIANSFLIYRSGSGTLGLATVTDGNGNVHTYQVTN